MSTRITRSALLLAPLPLAMLLAACGSSEPDYEVDAVDESGGEMIATPADEEAVPVDLPETEMTMVPDAEATPEDPAPAE